VALIAWRNMKNKAENPTIVWILYTIPFASSPIKNVPAASAINQIQKYHRCPVWSSLETKIFHTPILYKTSAIWTKKSEQRRRIVDDIGRK
jgi:hypothetical protein